MYKMLVVDDESLMREYLKTNVPALNPRWYVSGEAADGQEAISHLRSQRFDLVVTDIKMPEMDGLELIKIIAEEFPRQKVVILSGYDEFNFAKEAIHNGVYDYLLKPVISEELEGLLSKITQHLDNQKKNEVSYKALENLSLDAKKQVVKYFLKAVVSNSNTEIKALYPLIYRMKLDLVESEGIIVLVDINEEDVLMKSMPVSDIPVFKFILNQIVTETLEEEKTGIPFFDHLGQVAILVSGEDREEIDRKTHSLYEKLSSAMHDNTGIAITFAKGVPVNDMLQLNVSYARASQMLIYRLKASGNIFMDADNSMHLDDFKLEVEKAISMIKSAVLDNNEANLLIAVSDYINIINDISISALYRYGIYLIKSIAGLMHTNGDLICSATGILNQMASGLKTEYTKESAVGIYMAVLKSISSHSAVKECTNGETSIVEKAREFIYKHYSEPISLGLIAENIGISPSYLSDMFHKNVGESYIKFLTHIRMEQAAKFLRKSSMEKISDVSEKVGYASVKHFMYIFKQHFGVTPGEYQQKNTNKSQ